MIRMAVILLTLVISNEVAADIYKFTDADGHVYYTNINVPRHGMYRRIIKTKIFHYPNNYRSNYTGKVRSFSGANKRRFAELIEQAAFRYQVDAKLVHAVIQTESAYNSTVQSPKGAVGLMQLMPDTARRFGVTDRNDPDQNIDGGTRYLKHLIKLFDPNLDLAVAAYNAGENAVIKYNNSIPPYPETQNYVKQVLALYKR
ncbi:MAG: transglycosylase SLT domain-containing protein [Methylococcales bacterium]|nr:transglycosylase SLT domain-containing protein [Methylococcales bacterium]